MINVVQLHVIPGNVVRGVARLTLTVGHTFYNTTYLAIAIPNGMLVHTCTYLWMF